MFYKTSYPSAGINELDYSMLPSYVRNPRYGTGTEVKTPEDLMWATKHDNVYNLLFMSESGRNLL